MKWFEKTKRAYLLDYQMPDVDQMPIGQLRNLIYTDAEAIVDRLHRAGVQAIYMHAKDNQGNAYYNTKYGHKHSCIGDADLMAEMSKACRARAMNLLFYIQLTRERRGVEHYSGVNFDGTPSVRENPELLAPDDDAHPAMCLNGGGREYIKNIARELAENYDFDGYWLDNPNAWMTRTLPCYCRICRGKYHEEMGRDLPTPDDKQKQNGAWKEYLDYRIDLNTKIYWEIVRTIRNVNPELTVVNNGTNYSISQSEEFCDLNDYVTHEFHYNVGFGNLSTICRKNDAIFPNRNFEVESWRFFNRGFVEAGKGTMLRAYQVRPIDHLLTEQATIIANNGLVQYYDQIRPDGRLDELSMVHLEKAFSYVRKMEPYIPNGQIRVDYASLVWSKRTESFAIDTHKAAHSSGFQGFSYALIEKQIFNRFVMERDLAKGEFGDPKVLVLENVECLSEEAAEQVRRYVESGGGLIATYRTSLADRMGRMRKNFLLADLFGCDYVEPMSFSYSLYRFEEEHPLTTGIPLDWDQTLWSKLQLKVEPREGAEPVGNIVNPMRGMKMGHPPQEKTYFPAAVTNTYGDGRVVYFPQPLGELYYEYGHEHQQRLIENAVRWAAGVSQPVEIEAPETVESILYEHDNKYYLHLVNRTPCGSIRLQANTFNRAIPVHDIKVRVNEKITGAIRQPEGISLELSSVTMPDGTADIGFSIDELEIHAVIVMEKG